MTVELVGDRLREAQKFREIVWNAEHAPLMAQAAFMATEISQAPDSDQAVELSVAS